uniref:ZP domain-containing protein n=1 Tax=Heterorhabditis bacteriophora TaxID=37862 RepID=A0A1I7WPN8_HETBA
MSLPSTALELRGSGIQLTFKVIFVLYLCCYDVLFNFLYHLILQRIIFLLMSQRKWMRVIDGVLYSNLMIFNRIVKVDRPFVSGVNDPRRTNRGIRQPSPRNGIVNTDYDTTNGRRCNVSLFDYFFTKFNFSTDFLLKIKFNETFTGAILTEKGDPNCVYVNGSIQRSTDYEVKLIWYCEIDYRVVVRDGDNLDAPVLNRPLAVGDRVVQNTITKICVGQISVQKKLLFCMLLLQNGNEVNIFCNLHMCANCKQASCRNRMRRIASSEASAMSMNGLTDLFLTPFNTSDLSPPIPLRTTFRLKRNIVNTEIPKYEHLEQLSSEKYSILYLSTLMVLLTKFCAYWFLVQPNCRHSHSNGHIEVYNLTKRHIYAHLVKIN